MYKTHSAFIAIMLMSSSNLFLVASVNSVIIFSSKSSSLSLCSMNCLSLGYTINSPSVQRVSGLAAVII
jgi:hypothetical protein